MREYDALVEVWEDSRKFQDGLVAALRSDLHNNGQRDYGRTFEPDDFRSGASAALEDRVAELIEQGMNPAAAVAVAMSKRTKEQQIQTIDSIRTPKAPADGKRSRRA